MKTTSPSCFISYCHEGMDRDTLDYFLHVLKSHFDSNIKLYFDQDIPYGANFHDFMSLLERVDAVLILLTPQYLGRVLNRHGGVYEEYKTIMQRYDMTIASKKDRHGSVEGDAPISRGFDLIPILYSGTSSESIPNELRILKYLDLVGLRAHRNATTGEYIIPDRQSSTYLAAIKLLARQINAAMAAKGPTFEEYYHEYFNRLFVELKADWNNPAYKGRDYVDALFVKNFVFKKVDAQTVLFVIGRKGSGKSTLSDVLSILRSSRYRGLINILADEIDLEFLYALFNASRLEAETKHAFKRTKCFEFAWRAFIYIWCMDSLLSHIKKESPKLKKEEEIELLSAFLTDITRADNDSAENDKTMAYFTYAYNAVDAFINHCVSSSRNKDRYFLSDITSQFTLLRYIDFAIGKKIINALSDLLITHDKKVLFTLDGFDTPFDEFRRVSLISFDFAEGQKRAEFEIDWLRSLLSVVLQMRSNKQRSFTLLDRYFDFCITIPEDRFLQVQMTERDSYRYSRRYSSLDWSGIELALLLRKRLEELCQAKAKRIGSVQDRLEDILKKHYKHIPLDVDFVFNGRRYVMPLFMYVLRHTFWRPREVLLYYAAILAMAEDLRRKHHEITTEMLRKTVNAATFHIIRDEFINEFESTIYNFREIIAAFHGQKQVMPFSQIRTLLEPLTFKFTLSNQQERDTAAKIYFLYRIGFLGIMAKPSDIGVLGVTHEHVFVFNEGMTPFRGAVSPNLLHYDFVIHPIFCEYLQLDTSSNDLILVFNWKYLKDMEALIEATGTGRV